MRACEADKLYIAKSISCLGHHKFIFIHCFSFFAVQKDKTTAPGLKRTLSEGNGNDEKDDPNTKRDLKRPKMQNDELEAKLELKITAKAGAHPKLEKVFMFWNMLNFLK